MDLKCVLKAAVGPALLAAAASANAVSISNGVISAGITDGTVYDGGISTGLVRLADGFDPIQPGTPRDSYGVAAGALAGYVDPFFFGTSNIVTGSVASGADTARVSSRLTDGGGAVLKIVQEYSFLADNVLGIRHSVYNKSGSAQDVLFARNVDWDIDPTAFDETVTVDALSGPVYEASWNGFNDPSPLGFWDVAPAGGGSDRGDNGAGFKIDLGTLAAGAGVGFDVFYSLNNIGQTEAELRAQLAGLGATFSITGVDSIDGRNAAGLSFGSTFAVPEPASSLLFGLGALGLAVVRRRSK